MILGSSPRLRPPKHKVLPVFQESPRFPRQETLAGHGGPPSLAVRRLPLSGQVPPSGGSVSLPKNTFAAAHLPDSFHPEGIGNSSTPAVAGGLVIQRLFFSQPSCSNPCRASSWLVRTAPVPQCPPSSTAESFFRCCSDNGLAPHPFQWMPCQSFKSGLRDHGGRAFSPGPMMYSLPGSSPHQPSDDKRNPAGLAVLSQM